MRFTDAVRGAFLTAGIVALLAAGCGPAPSTSPQASNTPPPGYPPQGPPPQGAPPGGPPPRGGVLAPAERAKAENDLKQIVLAYHEYINGGRPPAKPDDLYASLGGAQTPAAQGLASGKYVFFWNVGLAQMTEGTSNTVLAYYKDTPTAGGPVGMADGSTKVMTADEFKNAPKAGK